jgi:hypothetical protein
MLELYMVPDETPVPSGVFGDVREFREKARIAVLAGGWKIDRETHCITGSVRADYREHRGTGSSQISLDLTIYSSQWNCREKFSIP